jgi:hypothetical protein
MQAGIKVEERVHTPFTLSFSGLEMQCDPMSFRFKGAVQVYLYALFGGLENVNRQLTESLDSWLAMNRVHR